MATNRVSIFLTRDPTGRIISFESDEPNFNSTRQVEGSSSAYWEPRRRATHVPLAIETPGRDQYLKSADFALLPEHLKNIFDTGAILRTSPFPASNYSALMYATPDNPPAGRTGVLFYLGEPIIITVAGKEFIVEVKGVGSPNGDNQYSKPMTRTSVFGDAKRKLGGLEPELALLEFANLEMLRLFGVETFVTGNSPRGLALMLYEGGVTYAGKNTQQGYLLRLSPGSIRASFEDHTLIPNIENRAHRMALEFANALAELMLLPGTQIQLSSHPENFIVTPNGYKITDFSDVMPLTAFDEPYKQVFHLLDSMASELLGGTASDQVLFFEQLCEGLQVKYSPTAGNTFVLFDKIWHQFLAHRLYQARQAAGTFKERNALLLAIVDFKKTLATVDQEICALVDAFISKTSTEKKVVAGDLSEAKNRLQQLQTASHDLSLARSLFENMVFSDDEHVEDFVDGQVKWQASVVKMLEDELPGHDQRITEIELISEDPKALAAYDRFFYKLEIATTIRKFLQQEELLLRFMTDTLAQASLQKARAGMRYIDSLFNPYDVVEAIRKNPRLLEEMVDLPYLKTDPDIVYDEIQASEPQNQDLETKGTGLAAITAYETYLSTAGSLPLLPAAFLAR